jgi:hypothetical protein
MAMDPHEIQRFNMLVQKLDVLDRKLTFLFQHLGVQYLDQRPPPNPIEQLVINGDRLGAIKLFQTTYNVGLADAKRAIEDIAARLGL